MGRNYNQTIHSLINVFIRGGFLATKTTLNINLSIRYQPVSIAF